MFDHLDDPTDFIPDDALHVRVLAQGRTRRRIRQAAKGFASVIVVVMGVVAGAVAYANHQLDNIHRVHIAAIETNRRASHGGVQVVFFGGLDIGPPGDPASNHGTRSDTMILARVDPAANTLTLLPLPRDLWVAIPGHPDGRLLTAYLLGGPDLLIRTVETDLGVHIDRYVESDFTGAEAIGDALGGLRLAFPNPVRDPFSGTNLPGGCTTLDGTQLVGLARSRHLEQRNAGGYWIPDGTGDLGRVERQQAIALALLQRISQLNAHDPLALVRLVDAAQRALTVDSGTTNADLIALVRGIAGAKVQQVRLGVADDVEAGAAVLKTTDQPQTMDAFRAGLAHPDHPVTEVSGNPVVPIPC